MYKINCKQLKKIQNGDRDGGKYGSQKQIHSRCNFVNVADEMYDTHVDS